MAEKGSGLSIDLSGAPFALAVQLADRPLSEALPAFDQSVLETRTTTLFADLARRALARVAMSQGGGEAFGPELFAEATGYFAARDLPSVVGARGRVQSAKEALALKVQLRNETIERVRGVTVDPRSDWRGYVDQAIAVLTGVNAR
jgi:hypothetical protein